MKINAALYRHGGNEITKAQQYGKCQQYKGKRSDKYRKIEADDHRNIHDKANSADYIKPFEISQLFHRQVYLIHDLF